MHPTDTRCRDPQQQHKQGHPTVPKPTKTQARTCSEGAVGGGDVFEVEFRLRPQVGRLQVGVVLLAQPPPGLLDLHRGAAAK